MDTEILKVTEDNMEDAARRAAKLLLAGEIIGLPTETVYGLAANAYNKDAIKKVFRAKGRPQDNPMIVHISDFVMFKDIAEITDEATELARVFWPGPLTLVLRKTPLISNLLTSGLPTVAVRMPSHPVAQAVIATADVPLAVPSANLSGSPSPTTAQHVFDDLGGKIPLILDGGGSEVGVESTVLSLSGERPVVLRPGIVTLEQIQAVLPQATLSDAVFSKVDANAKVESPGMKYRHYAPRAEVIVVKSDLDTFVNYVEERRGDSVCAMCFDGEQEAIPIPSISYGRKGDGASQARRLFSVLRTMDKLGFLCIFVRAPEEAGESMAVFNRLIRAAGFKVVEL